MNPEPDEFRDFPQPVLIVNDELAHPFSSSQTINSDLLLPEEFPIEETKQIVKHNQIQEYSFEQEKIPIDQENSFEKLNKKFQSLQIECERTQRITTHFEK